MILGGGAGGERAVAAYQDLALLLFICQQL